MRKNSLVQIPSTDLDALCNQSTWDDYEVHASVRGLVQPLAERGEGCRKLEAMIADHTSSNAVIHLDTRIYLASNGLEAGDGRLMASAPLRRSIPPDSGLDWLR